MNNKTIHFHVSIIAILTLSSIRNDIQAQSMEIPFWKELRASVNKPESINTEQYQKLSSEAYEAARHISKDGRLELTSEKINQFKLVLSKGPAILETGSDIDFRNALLHLFDVILWDSETKVESEACIDLLGSIVSSYTKDERILIELGAKPNNAGLDSSAGKTFIFGNFHPLVKGIDKQRLMANRLLSIRRAKQLAFDKLWDGLSKIDVPDKSRVEFISKYIPLEEVKQLKLPK